MEKAPGPEHFMRRCFDLARLGAGVVSPNPLVGSVLVHGDRIIGEGFHRQYGSAHAERNAIYSVRDEDRHLIPESTLYISLEPCCHHGKTPPCTDLIRDVGIRKVCISTLDPNPLVCGKGMHRLEQSDIHVRVGVLQDEGEELVRFFRTFMLKHRPHIILKFVQSADGFIGRPDRQVWLSNEYERVMVHKLRSEIDAILVGTNTAVLDNPRLTTRSYPGKNPIRIVLDRTGRIPESHHLFDRKIRTILYSETLPARDDDGFRVKTIIFDDHLIPAILADLFEERIQSLLVEGGAELIRTFLSQNFWDEALVVRTPKILESGVKAPCIQGRLKWKYQIAGDEILSIVPENRPGRT